MTKREIAVLLAVVLLAGGLALWGAIAAIDHFALGEDAVDAPLHQR
jgi:hypothetical protein